MTLEEYARYELAMSSKKTINTPLGFTPKFFDQLQHTPNPPLNEKDSSLEKILDDLFRRGADNLRKMEHEVPNRCDDLTDYEDSDQEYGELPDPTTFSATNEFANVCKQVKENIDVNTARELEEVQVEDVEMDENNDIYHSTTKEADPFLVLMDPRHQSNVMQQITLSSISNEIKREFKILHRFAGSNSKKTGFEVTTTRKYVVKHCCLQQLRRNHYSYAINVVDTT
ncbi:hypothetical protein Tco_1366569 [Tanacetum coccineum]